MPVDKQREARDNWEYLEEDRQQSVLYCCWIGKRDDGFMLEFLNYVSGACVRCGKGTDF